MNVSLQILRNARWALVVVILTALAITAAPAVLQECQAGDGPSRERAQTAQTPKIKEVLEFPEEFVGKEFSYTVWVTSHAAWMARAGEYLFLFVKDAEGSKLPRGFDPASAVNLMRLILPKDEGRKLIDQLNASRFSAARIHFKVERE